MKTIAVITSTRAEFGLLLPVIREIEKLRDESFGLELVVTGTHLSRAGGCTVDEILENGLIPNVTVEIPTESDSVIDIANNQAATLNSFTELFLNKKYSGIVILGDRYEVLSIAIAAGNTHMPIFHLCGGDTTEGAIDEWIRHSITKMSYLHFPTNEESYRRIIQLGESPDRVFNFGSTSIDNIINAATMSKEEVLESIGLTDCRYAVCTYHPVTMNETDVNILIKEFLAAIKESPEIEFVVTKSNADLGGANINMLLDEAQDEIDNLHVFSSLGMVRYLSLMKCSEFVLGNSSSGIIEAPAFGIPTINIGDRQLGRLQSESVINCKEDKTSILEAIDKALSKEFRSICEKVVSPYGDGHAAERIAHKIYEVVIEDNINLKKKFFNIKDWY